MSEKHSFAIGYTDGSASNYLLDRKRKTKWVNDKKPKGIKVISKYPKSFLIY